MQEGGPAMFTPFAVDPEGSPRRRIAPTYQPNPPPTIALPPIAPITPTPTPEQLNISPDPNYMGSIDMTLAQAGADRDGLGPISPHWSQEFLSTLEARGRPETDLSRTLDRGFNALATPALAVATLAVPAIAPMTGLFSAVTGKGGGGILSSALSAMGSKPTSTTTPLSAAVQNSAQQFAAVSKSTAPVGYTYPGGGFGATVTPASTTLEPTIPASARQAIAAINQTPAAAPAPAVTAAQVGSDKALFGASFGQGRGGKGMFSSFDHYAAGINEGEEASIVAMGINSGAFANTQEGADTVDSMVSQGYDQNGVVAVASGMGTQPGQADYDFGAPSGGGGDGKGIVCTQMYQTTGHADWEKAMKLWYIYQVKYLTPLHQEGYHYLFGPFVKGMKKSRVLTSIGAYFAKHRTNQIKHELFKVSPFDVVGKLTNLFLHPTVYVAGKFKNLMENKTNA